MLDFPKKTVQCANAAKIYRCQSSTASRFRPEQLLVIDCCSVVCYNKLISLQRLLDRCGGLLMHPCTSARRVK